MGSYLTAQSFPPFACSLDAAIRYLQPAKSTFLGKKLCIISNNLYDKAEIFTSLKSFYDVSVEIQRAVHRGTCSFADLGVTALKGFRCGLWSSYYLLRFRVVENGLTGWATRSVKLRAHLSKIYQVEIVVSIWEIFRVCYEQKKIVLDHSVLHNGLNVARMGLRLSAKPNLKIVSIAAEIFYFVSSWYYQDPNDKQMGTTGIYNKFHRWAFGSLCLPALGIEYGKPLLATMDFSVNRREDGDKIPSLDTPRKLKALNNSLQTCWEAKRESVLEVAKTLEALCSSTLEIYLLTIKGSGDPWASKLKKWRMYTSIFKAAVVVYHEVSRLEWGDWKGSFEPSNALTRWECRKKILKIAKPVNFAISQPWVAVNFGKRLGYDVAKWHAHTIYPILEALYLYCQHKQEMLLPN